MIFGFGPGVFSSRKFSLLNQGEFLFLDEFMGGRWDIRLGKDADSFFKYVTYVEISTTHDFLLVCTVKFSESTFRFCDNYRSVAKDNIIQRKNEIAAINND